MSSTIPGPESERRDGSPAVDPALRHTNIGRLLLRAFDRFELTVVDGLRQAGFEDFSLGHGSALRNIDLEGTRVSEVARRAHMTKQGMSQLLKSLEKRAYVRLEPDPRDGRARLAFLTGKGESLIAAGQQIFRELEANWRAELGTESYTALKAALRKLDLLEGPAGPRES